MSSLLAQEVRRCVRCCILTTSAIATLCGTGWAQPGETSKAVYADVVVPGVVSVWIKYLQLDEVQQILELDEAQVQAVRVLRTKPLVVATEGELPPGFVEAIRESIKEVQSAIQSILSPQQFVTLRQIELQQSSVGRWENLCETLVRADVSASLGLTEEQHDAIKALEPEYLNAKEEMHSKIRKGLATGRDLHNLRQQFNPLDVLSTDQRLHWRKMLSTPRNVSHVYKAPG